MWLVKSVSWLAVYLLNPELLLLLLLKPYYFILVLLCNSARSNQLVSKINSWSFEAITISQLLQYKQLRRLERVLNY